MTHVSVIGIARIGLLPPRTRRDQARDQKTQYENSQDFLRFQKYIHTSKVFMTMRSGV
jgi:hypothetical protein